MNTAPATLSYPCDANGTPVSVEASWHNTDAFRRAFKAMDERRRQPSKVYFAPPQHHMMVLHMALNGQGHLLEPLRDPNNTVLDNAPEGSLDELLGTELPDEG